MLTEAEDLISAEDQVVAERDVEGLARDRHGAREYLVTAAGPNVPARVVMRKDQGLGATEHNRPEYLGYADLYSLSVPADSQQLNEFAIIGDQRDQEQLLASVSEYRSKQLFAGFHAAQAITKTL